MSRYAEQAAPGRSPFAQTKHRLLPSLDLELTERCNNNCLHCCINQPPDSPLRDREMSTAEVQRILGEAAELGCLHVRFTGGEALLRDDFDEIYMTARRLGMSVLLFTNARLITPERAALFAHIRPRAPIEITVYGMRRDSYEAVSRSDGSFAEFRDGVALLAERAVPFVLKTVLLPQNRKDLPDFEAWAASANARGYPPQITTVLDLRHRRDSPARNRVLAALRAAPDQVLAHFTRDASAYREEMKLFCSRFMRPAGAQLFACGACHGGCVDPYGRLQPCLSLRAPETAYDLRQGSLRHALTEVFPALQGTATHDPEYLARCGRCFLKGLCEQCPAKSWIETGRLDAPVMYHCEIAHAQARYLGLLGADERAWTIENGHERVERLVHGG